MAKIYLGLRDLDDNQVEHDAEQQYAAQLTNAELPTKSPADTAFRAAIDDFVDKRDLVPAAEQALALARTTSANSRAVLEGIMTSRGKNVEGTLRGEGEALQRAGYKLQAVRQPVGDLIQPANFAVTRSDAVGSADGQCHKVVGARTYKVEHAISTNGPWTVGYEGTKSSWTILGLTPGTEYFFRMAAFGPNGWSPWSDIAACRIA